MMLKVKRALCAALAALCLAGCGKGADASGGAGGSAPAAARRTEAPEVAPARDLVEDATEDAGWDALSLAPDIACRVGAAPAREGVYVAFEGRLRLLGRDGSSDEVVAELPEDAAVMDLCSGGSGAWLALYFSEAERCELRFYGEEEERTAAGFDTDGFTPLYLCADGGRLFLVLTDYQGGDVLAVFSDSGEKEYETELGRCRNVAAGGGRVYVCAGSQIELSELDPETGGLTTLTELSGGNRLLSCDGEKIYLGDDTSAYELNADTLETRRLLDWTSCGVSGGSGMGLWPDGEGFIASWRNGLLSLTPREGAARRRVVLAVNGRSWRYSYPAVAFNGENEEYEIIIRDYSSYAEPEQILGAELAAGTGPDLVDASSFSGEILRKGVMTDLMTLLDDDGEISREDLLAGPLEAMRTENGELFAIAPSFTVTTLLRRAEGEGTLTAGLREFTGVADALRELGNPDEAFRGYMLRSFFLPPAFCCGDAGDYSEEDIAAILEYAAALPTAPDREAPGRTVWYAGLGSVTDPIRYALSFRGSEVKDLEIFGLPFREGTGAVSPETYLAIPANAGKAEGAWEFIKSMLRGRGIEGFLDNELPLLRSLYEEKKAEFAAQVESGLSMGYELGGEWKDYEVENLDCCELLDYVLDGVNGSVSEDSPVLDIVERGAAAYFAGEGTVDEAARAVRARLELYLGEKYG